MSTRPSIVLIGPSGSGKSTVAPIRARLLDRRPLDLDDLRQRYYPELDYDEAHADRLFTAGDLHGLTAYWKPFELHSVERVMTEFGRGHVIAFGAGQSVYRDVSDLHRARAALSVAGAVVLLLFSTDDTATFAVLKERIRIAAADVPAAILEAFDGLNRDNIGHASSRELATHVVVTAARSQEQVGKLIAERLQLSRARGGLAWRRC